MNFRKKIFLSFFCIFFLLMGAMFPIASRTVQNIVYTSISDRAAELIKKIQVASDDESLIERLKDQKFLIFFRVSVITNERKVLYDSYTKRLLGPRFNRDLVVRHPEVEEAFKKGVGFHNGESKLLGQRFTYMAHAFDFHGKTYVLRTAFPYKFVTEMTQDFELSFILIATLVLLLFSILSWFIIHRLTHPIDQIITAIKPYQEGVMTELPEIRVDAAEKDDFGKLARTLNLLSEKIQMNIDSLTQERNEKEAVLESLVEGVIAVDDKMIITYANHMSYKLLGLEAPLVGCSFIETGQHQFYALLERCQLEKKVLTHTTQVKNEEGKVYLDIIAAPQKGSGGAVLVMEDKTIHYKLLEMRKDFIANASHELRTPITIIRGFAETLHDHPELPRSTAVSITNKIVHNCTRMTTLIKDLLTLTDIENIPRSRLIECDLNSLIHNCSQMVNQVYPDATIRINKNPDEEVHLVADPNLMELAVMNLIENAAKYSSGPAQITITLDKEDHWVKLTIADKGIGIPSGDLEHIFERFYTVNKAHSRKMGGSGLGLSIVQTIIEKHAGKIGVASELGQGTTFTIHLRGCK